MKPPTGGPSIGPSKAGMVRYDIALTRSLRSTVPKQQQTTDRHHHRATRALDDAGQHEAGERTRKAAQNRPGREDDDRRAEYGPRAESIRDPAARRDEDGQSQKIRSQRQFQRDRILVQVACDRRQRRRQNRPVEVLHQQRAGDDQGGEGVSAATVVDSGRSGEPRPSTAAPDRPDLGAGTCIASRAAVRPRRRGTGCPSKSVGETARIAAASSGQPCPASRTGA